MTTPAENEPAETPGVHSFPRAIAEEHGVSEAIILSYLANKVDSATKAGRNRRDGKHWYYGTIDEIRERYPYIGRSTMGGILKRMEAKGLIERDNHNRRKGDKTGWYTIPEKYRNAHTQAAILLDVRVATDLGVPEAALIHNLRYWLAKWGQSSHRMSPSDLADRLPFDRKTITRGLRRLVEDGLIVKDPDPEKPGHYSPGHYSLPAPPPPTPEGEEETHVDQSGQSEGGTNPNLPGSNPNLVGTLPDMGGEKLDETGTKPDNVTHYKPFGNTVGNTIGKVPLKKKDSVFFQFSQSNPNELHENPSSASHPGIQASGLDTGVAGEKPGTDRLNANAGVSRVSSDPSSRQAKTRPWHSVTLDDLAVSNATLMKGLSPQEVAGQCEEAKVVCNLISDRMDLTTFKALLEEADSPESILQELQRALKHSIVSDPRFKDLKPREAESSIHIALEVMTILFYQHGKALPPLNPPAWARSIISDAWWKFSCRLERLPQEECEEPFLSKDRDMEELADLKPEVKVQVLINAITSMNKVARISHSSQRAFFHDPKGRKYARRLFKLNPSLTVAQLMEPIMFCTNEISRLSSKKRDDFDPLFHARNARSLYFFVKNLPKILEQLEEHCLYPTDGLQNLEWVDDEKELPDGEKSKGEKSDEP